MSSFPKPLIDIPENELSEQTKEQRDKMVKLGYDIRHLVLIESGEVLFDPELSDYDAFTQSAAKYELGK